MKVWVGAGLAALLAFAWTPAAAAQSAPCPSAPSLTPAFEAPSAPLTSAKRTAAVKAQRAWAAPRLAYGACRRAEIEAIGGRVNELGAQINALVEEANPIDRKIRAARAARDDAFRAYAERRKLKPTDLPVAGRDPIGEASPPCGAPPSVTAAPEFPNGANASAGAMKKADEALNDWAHPLELYLACRKAERKSLVSAYEDAKADYGAAQTDYAAYRAAFNAAVARFETRLTLTSADIAKP